MGNIGDSSVYFGALPYKSLESFELTFLRIYDPEQTMLAAMAHHVSRLLQLGSAKAVCSQKQLHTLLAITLKLAFQTHVEWLVLDCLYTHSALELVALMFFRLWLEVAELLSVCQWVVAVDEDCSLNDCILR